MKKKLLVGFLALALALTGCAGGGKTGNSGGSDDKILVGGLGPLTGKVAIYGITSTNGAKLAFDEINAAGGILGKQVEFLLEDEKGEVNEAKNAFGKLVNQNIVALIGDITSGPSYAVGEDAQEYGVPMITPTGTQFNITEGRDKVFRVCFTDPYQGVILAKYVKENLKKDNVAVMRNTSSDYSNGVVEQFEKTAKELGLTITDIVSYGDDDKDFKAQLSQLKAKNPEVLMIPDYYEKIALIAPQAREVGIDALFLGPDGWDGVVQQLSGDEKGLKTIDGAVFANHYSTQDTNEKVQHFVKAYREKYKEEPTAFSALSYDAVYLLKAAIEKANSTDREAIAKALNDIQFEGVTGNLKFDENHNPIKDVTMVKIQDGQYVLDTVVKN